MVFSEIISTISGRKKAVENGKLDKEYYERMLVQICQDHDFGFIAKQLSDEMARLDPPAKAAESRAWAILKPMLEKRLHILIAQIIAGHPEASAHFAMISEMERAISGRDRLEVVRAELHRAYNEIFNSQKVEV